MGDGDKFAFLLPIVMLTFAVTFAVAARWNSRPARLWASGYALAGAAYLAPVALANAPLVAQALLADTGFLLAFWCYGQALLEHFGKPRRKLLNAVPVALGLAGAVYAVAVLGDMRVETLVNDIACATLILLPLAAIGFGRRKPIDWAIIGVSLVVVVDNLMRTVVFNLVLPTQTSLGAFAGSPYDFAMQVTGSTFGLVFGLVALGSVVLRVVDGYRDAAERDPLTGLFNRRGFEGATAGLKADRPASVVICDIDHFKAVNDAFGHAAGDRVLAGFAETVRIVLPPDGVAARFGGEEFVLFLPGPPRVAAVVAEVLRIAFAERDWTPEGVEGGLTASFGVAESAIGDPSLFDTIARADANLYAAKKAGRNRVVTRLPVKSAARRKVLSAAA